MDKWFSSEFPNLSKEFFQMNVKKRGTIISRLYESQLFLDWRILKYADELGIKLSRGGDKFYPPDIFLKKSLKIVSV